ncbi:CBS domain-containing protein, partial [Mycobacterium tuberculosis]|nr:CBS domain-containing protein [Mycobacterium tuberculosis]
AIARAREAGESWVVVVDKQDRPRAWPSIEEIASKPEISDYLDPRLPVVAETSTLNDALASMLAASQGGTLVTDRHGAVVGMLTIASVMDIIRGQLAESRPEEDDASYESHTEGTGPIETPVVAADDPEQNAGA